MRSAFSRSVSERESHVGGESFMFRERVADGRARWLGAIAVALIASGITAGADAADQRAATVTDQRVALAADQRATDKPAATKPANATRGKQLYMATGCYQCHGTRGEGGGNAGPRVAPGPLPYAGFLQQLRHPRARMPVYTAVVMPDTDVADIYAYLSTVPKGKTAQEIPMLEAISTSPVSAN
jgi:mono/diheme cytochrome c family protein